MVQKHTIAFALAGVCSVFATVVSVGHAVMHLRNYNDPAKQRLIIRIMWMVPIYAIDSVRMQNWFSLYYRKAALYLDTIRDVYEAYVVYNFFILLIEYLGGASELMRVLRTKEALKHPAPLGWCLKPINVASPRFFETCKVCILQFVLVKPAMAFLAIMCEIAGVYQDGSIFNPKAGYLYVTLVNNAAVTCAMYFLVLFYLATAHELQPHKPKLKFLCIKAVLFFSFWQSIVIALLAKEKVIHDVGSWTSEDVATGLQDFLICIEMAVAAVAHCFAFSYKPFEHQDTRTPLISSAVHSASVSDVFNETSQTLIRPLGRTVASVLRPGASGNIQADTGGPVLPVSAHSAL